MKHTGMVDGRIARVAADVVAGSHGCAPQAANVCPPAQDQDLNSRQEREGIAVSTGGMGSGGAVLLVSEDRLMRSALRMRLEGDGYTVLEASSHGEMQGLIRSQPIGLIALDIGAGHGRGLEITRETRRRLHVPILVITGGSARVERAVVLENGADDCVAKPLRAKRVAQQIHALWQRYRADLVRPESDDEIVLFGDSILDTTRRELRRRRDNSLIAMTRFECKLLELFLRHPERVLTRDEINLALRGREWSPLDRTIDGHIVRLRRKIEPATDEATLIKTVRGVGYVFCAERRRSRRTVSARPC
jgi:DNA-binding response OmpR family regulator